jgi:hypothetical protein
MIVGPLLLTAAFIGFGAWILRKDATVSDHGADWGKETPRTAHTTTPAKASEWLERKPAGPVMIPVPGAPVVVDWVQMVQWLATLPPDERPNVRSWHDLDAVNEVRRKNGLPPFSRAPFARKVR